MIEMVLAIALFFAVGSTFVFAMSTVAKIETSSNEKVKSAISESGVSNIFRKDINNAKAINLVSETYLQIAKSDGTCVNWNFNSQSSGYSGLYRSEATGEPAGTDQSEIRSGVANAYFTVSGNDATINFLYPRIPKFSQTATAEVAGSDGGVCWS